MEIAMEKCYRIIYQSFDKSKPSKVLEEKTLLEDTLTIPTNCLDISIGLENQIKLIQTAQDAILSGKFEGLYQDKCSCPKCQGRLVKDGTHTSTLHDALTDQKVKIQRMRCKDCGYELPSTVRTLFNTTHSGDLKKIQATLGANFTFRESEQILELFSCGRRKVNNHYRVKQLTESAGNKLAEINEEEKELIVAPQAKELVVNVDGGHIKTTEDKRSMEAMTSVVYDPKSICSNSKDTRNYLSSKNCAASIKDDDQQQIISGTIIAALKQGLTEKTHVTALCDGAENCWNVVEALRPLCGSMTCILDWFHLAMKLENIALPEKLKSKLLRIKWHLWRGNVDKALIRLSELVVAAKQEKHIKRIEKFVTYINNNKDRIINYKERKESGLIFTSNLAESTVESLINRRCKGQQHMRWSREGLDPILQLRASISSNNDWAKKWRDVVINA